jgi:hypothetical protein
METRAVRKEDSMPQKEYEFTLILSGIDELSDEVLDRLYENGCDDALLGVRDGVVFADFSRAARSLTDAVLSASRDIMKAKVGATVVHVEPDEFVTMSEIARRLDLTREGVRKWVVGTRGPGQFPPPVGNVRRKSPLWRWTDVLNWYESSLPSLQAKPKAADRKAPKADQQGVHESATNLAALNAALDLVRYAGSEGAARLLKAVTTHRK